MATGQGNKLTNPIYTSKKVNGRYVPNDSRCFVDYLTDITSISNAYVGMKVLVWKENENAQTELNKWYKVTAVNSLGKPTAYAENGGAGMTQEQQNELTALTNFLLDSTAEFSTGATYAVGDVVKYNGTLYYFYTAHGTAGAWNENEVRKVSVGWLLYTIDNAQVSTDSSVTSGSTKPVQSGAVYTALQGKADTNDVGSNANLTTTAKGTLVAAINEIDANVGAARVMLYNILNGTSYSTIAQIEAAEQQNNA